MNNLQHKGEFYTEPCDDNLPCWILWVHCDSWFSEWKQRKLNKTRWDSTLWCKGVFDGAAIVYFSYIGYDSVSTMAEEIKNPSKNLPVGIVGSVLIVSILYCLMALSLCMLLPYNKVRVYFIHLFIDLP